MTSRERVIAALEHREPDRIPVDLGGTIMTGIAVQALADYQSYLGKQGTPKAYELYQMLGEVELELVDALEIDVLPVEPEALFFEIRRTGYKPFTLFDGTEVLIPGEFQVETDETGNWLLHDGGRSDLPLAAKMPNGGYYFDMVKDQSLHLDFQPPDLKKMSKVYSVSLPREKLDFLAQRVEKLRPTEKALLLGAWLDFGPPSVGSTPDWLCLMVADPGYVEELFIIKAEGDLNRLNQLREHLGDGIDVFGVDGADYGTQRAEMFNPELFERFHVPFYRKVNGWIHENTGWKTWKHSCGSIPRLIPLLAESGLDAINPVQTSARGMQPVELKEQFSSLITFWGGGVDTQRTLPFESPEDVYRQVSERIALFGKGGGFVFAAVHNIQAKTPPENIEAMFQAVRDRGTYPLSDSAVQK